MEVWLVGIWFFFQTKDWWSYEFCYGKNIKQFHVGDGKSSSFLSTITDTFIVVGLMLNMQDIAQVIVT